MLWSADGTWERLLQHVQAVADAKGGIDWDINVDSTSIRAHQHVAGAPKATPPAPANVLKGAGERSVQVCAHLLLCRFLAEVVRQARRSADPAAD